MRLLVNGREVHAGHLQCSPKNVIALGFIVHAGGYGNHSRVAENGQHAEGEQQCLLFLLQASPWCGDQVGEEMGLAGSFETVQVGTWYVVGEVAECCCSN